MIFHIVSLPHTQVTRAYDWCAYTAKVRRLCDMLVEIGHEVYLYAGEEHETSAELVTVVNSEQLTRWFGSPRWDTSKVFEYWDSTHPSWMEMNVRAMVEIQKRIQPGHIVGIIAGQCQSLIHDMFKDTNPVVEWGIGYSGVVADFRVFESYAWRHHVAGLRREDDVRFFDTVIPNSYHPSEFDSWPSYMPRDYLLFMGRPTARKGQDIIRAISEAMPEQKIVTAGQGGGWLPGAEHRGVVLGQEKIKLISEAKALLSPSVYLEPFGGIHAEAMLMGVPVITTDWGAYTETVENGTNGFRCSTLQGFLDAIHNVGYLNRSLIAADARHTFSTERVARQYDFYFRKVSELYAGQSWYTL